MKFLIKKGLDYSTLLHKLMLFVAVSLFFYLLLDIFLHYLVIGLDIQSISTTLYGNEEAYIEAILIDTLLLQIHIDLFMNIVTLMIISTLYIRFFSTHKMTTVLVHILFIMGILAPIGLLLAYFSSVLFVYIWLISFIFGHILAMSMAVLIAKRLVFR